MILEEDSTTKQLGFKENINTSVAFAKTDKRKDFPRIGHGRL